MDKGSVGGRVRRVTGILVAWVMVLFFTQCTPFEMRDILDKAGVTRLTITPSGP